MRNRENEGLLELKELTVAYKHRGPATSVLKQVSLTIRKGEILALLGESGSGKSTIAKALMGLLPPSALVSSGELHMDSYDKVDLMSKKIAWERIRGRKIAMLFQDARQALNPLMTIREHFNETLRFHKLAAGNQVDSIALQWLQRLHFKEAAAVLEQYPFQLSGGMCQRICLALTLCLEPEVLIADEPTSALDTVSQKEALELLRSLQQELGLAVLLITHDIAVANAISNRVIVLSKGEIVEEGATRAVLAKPSHTYTKKLIASRPHAAAMPVRSSSSSGEPLLEVVQLEKEFLGRSVLHNIHLTIKQGDIVGLLGQSGCGKSTLARCITGLEAPSQGRILYGGHDIVRLQGKQRRDMCKHIQLVFQDARASLNPRRTALELVKEPLQYLQLGQRKERESLAAYYLHEVGITGEAQHRRPPQLSTGQCQRIAIARALVLGPKLLICDEAVSALDMTVQDQILKLLRRLHKQFGFSMLMISHDIRVLQAFCHQIAVMEEGRICEVRQGAQLHESNQAYTQLLLRCAGDMEEGLRRGVDS
jgi:peptide/nickel transport system ATP-binding protein